ncbi:MAG TPA: EVE domain-containing protein, partial [Candidatus Bathyarchaeota archaeon]|nr:EVE domain-containing protein [Candidatus Bathyarchaeota archaeon]
MVNYWLCVTDRANWQVIRDKLVWGVSDRYKSVIEQVRVGDVLVFYVKPKRICGIFEVAS